MKCELCERDKIIKLQDGDISCSYCPKWRDETLNRSQTARGLVRIEDLEQRKEAIRIYGVNHGEEALNRMTDHIKLIWHDRHRIRTVKQVAKR